MRKATLIPNRSAPLPHLLGRVRFVSSYISSLRRAATSGDSRECAALRDCTETLADMAQLRKKSASEIDRLAKAKTSPEIGWCVSSALTWMSIMLTNEDKLMDGFEPVGAGPLKADVCRQVRSAKKYTSNALALVKKLVSSLICGPKNQTLNSREGTEQRSRERGRSKVAKDTSIIVSFPANCSISASN